VSDDGIVRLTTPLTDADVMGLKAGDRVRLTGILYTARDAAHQRLIAALDAGQPLPIDVRGQIVYYVGPTPPPPGKVIGSAGPTTGGRMDRYAPRLLALGLKGMIGKGHRSQPVREAMRHHKAVYFGAVGGAGALLARYITAAEIVAYEDLGTEAIRRLTVDNFPVVVVDDAHGNDLYEEGMKRYARPGPAEAAT
jgi:fumarate hydratase subunit beta